MECLHGVQRGKPSEQRSVLSLQFSGKLCILHTPPASPHRAQLSLCVGGASLPVPFTSPSPLPPPAPCSQCQRSGVLHTTASSSHFSKDKRNQKDPVPDTLWCGAREGKAVHYTQGCRHRVGGGITQLTLESQRTQHEQRPLDPSCPCWQSITKQIYPTSSSPHPATGSPGTL